MAKTVMVGKKKWYELDPKRHGVAGIQPFPAKKRKQDRRAKPLDCYGVVFFPQYNIGFTASVGFCSTEETLAQTPEAARVRYADRIGGRDHPEKKWRDYHAAGHRVRKLRIIDMGPA